MHITTVITGSTATLALSGRFDFGAHRDFRGATKAVLEHAAVRELVVNFARVDYMDSSALGMLLLLREGAEAAGKAVALQGADGMVRKVLEIANFDKIFRFA